MYILHETASGYSLFEAEGIEDVGKNLQEVQQDMLDLGKFGKAVTLKSFLPFKSAVHALENANSISEGIVHPSLKSFLELNMPASGKKNKSAVLGVVDKGLAASLKQEMGVECRSDDLVLEVIRGLRFHAEKLLKQLKQGDLEKAQLGLGHSYSRGKVRFNVNRSDNMIIQAIALVDQMDKDINLFSMRIREWYGWHFPELVKIVSDHGTYARLAAFIHNRATLSDEKLDKLAEITNDPIQAKQIIEASKSSMGTDISEIDMLNIDHFAAKLISLTDYRKRLGAYLQDKMHIVAPNLSALIGEIVGARLISQAGSLTNLAKFPASTVQILGAEKALFRALKTRGKTPKYGLIYHSSFIGRAGMKNKGRISRFLANKCSIASRIDCFSEVPSTAFGDVLKKQVEDRLHFYDNGDVPISNEMAMKMALNNQKEIIAVAAKATSTPDIPSSPAKTPKKRSKDSSSEKDEKSPKKAKLEKETKEKEKKGKKEKSKSK